MKLRTADFRYQRTLTLMILIGFYTERSDCVDSSPVPILSALGFAIKPATEPFRVPISSTSATSNISEETTTTPTTTTPTTTTPTTTTTEVPLPTLSETHSIPTATPGYQPPTVSFDPPSITSFSSSAKLESTPTPTPNPFLTQSTNNQPASPLSTNTPGFTRFSILVSSVSAQSGSSVSVFSTQDSNSSTVLSAGNITYTSDGNEYSTETYITSDITANPADSSVRIQMFMWTPYNMSFLDDIVAESPADELELMESVSEATNVSQSRLTLLSLDHGTQNGTLVMQFLIEKGVNPMAVAAARILQEEVSNGTVVFVDFYDNNINITEMTYETVIPSSSAPSDNCGCSQHICDRGQCSCSADGVASCDCSGSKCDKSQPWKIPIIIVIVLVTAFTVLLITAIICIRRHQMNAEDKEEVVAGSQSKKKKKNRVSPATITSKGSENADSIVFTVLEVGPAFEMRDKSGFEAGSLPRSDAYHSAIAAAAKNGTTRGAAFNQRSFGARDKIGRAASQLSHQY